MNSLLMVRCFIYTGWLCSHLVTCFRGSAVVGRFPHSPPHRVSTYRSTNDADMINEEERLWTHKLDRDFLAVALPAFVGLAAEPVVSLLDGIYVGRLGAVQQAAMGIAISAQYSVAKLYNDPLLKTSTSLVAGKSGDELSASVASALSTAVIIGLLQSVGYFLFAGQIMSFMSVSAFSEIRKPAVMYLKWRAMGVPAATVLIVANGIFRGRGDTTTPLLCTMVGHVCNIVLDPILIFGLNMGCAGAAAANAISQCVAVTPMLFLLHKSIPFNIIGREKGFLKKALVSYIRAGGLIFLRTVSKISTYTATSAAAASLGTIAMAAYSVTFNLGFTASQLCEAIAIASQALIARDMPLDSKKKRFSTAHVIKRSLQAGVVVSAALALATILNRESILLRMTKSEEVRLVAARVMPVVVVAQTLKGIASATGGILLGGLDWSWNAMGMTLSSIAAVLVLKLLPPSLGSIWAALTTFMGMQLMIAVVRIFSGSGPWAGLEFTSFLPFVGHQDTTKRGASKEAPLVGYSST